jgi:hypothetical protein
MSNPFDLTVNPGYKFNLFARIKWWFKRRKYIKERAKNGWSTYDVWDFDTYLAQLVGGALEFLSHSHMSHPHYYTPEEWSEKLKYISECFSQYNEERPCPSYEAYKAACIRAKEGNCVTVFGHDGLLRAWREEEQRNHDEKMKKLKEGFDLLWEIYPDLWD